MVDEKNRAAVIKSREDRRAWGVDGISYTIIKKAVEVGMTMPSGGVAAMDVPSEGDFDAELFLRQRPDQGSSPPPVRSSPGRQSWFSRCLPDPKSRAHGILEQSDSDIAEGGLSDRSRNDIGISPFSRSPHGARNASPPSCPGSDFREAIPITSAARMADLLQSFESAEFRGWPRSAVSDLGFISFLFHARTINGTKMMYSAVANQSCIPEPIPLESFVSARRSSLDYESLCRVAMAVMRVVHAFESRRRTFCAPRSCGTAAFCAHAV
jgi:hypothetical protein